jgi:cytoskeletal protein RodZ
MLQYLFAVWAFIMALLIVIVVVEAGFLTADAFFGSTQPQPATKAKAPSRKKVSPSKSAKKPPTKKSKKRSK